MKKKGTPKARTGTKKKAAKGADGEAAVLARIAEMPGPNREIGQKLHALITSALPELTPRLWFGLPAYARDGKMIVFFRSAHTFKERYMTVGFSDKANLDDGVFWPIYFALTELNGAAESRIVSLLKKAVS